jgi:hypothetical protein
MVIAIPVPLKGKPLATRGFKVETRVYYSPLLLVNNKSSVAVTDRTALE